MGAPFYAEYTIPITLPGPGSYLIQFWTLMFCNDLLCNDSEDLYKIYINKGKPLGFDISIEYDAFDSITEPYWKRANILFVTNSINVDVR